MAAKRGRLEIIEVLPDEPAHADDAGFDAPGPAIAAKRRVRWWIAPVAVAGIVAVVVGAGALSDSSPSDGAARRTTEETELQGAAAVVPEVLPLVPATPAGYRIVGATQTPAAKAADGPRAVRELWATNPDGSLLSSWVEITASRTGLDDAQAGDRRVAVPGGIAVLDTKGNGNIRIAGPLAGGGTAVIDSSGVSRPTLVELLSSLRFDGDALRSADERFGGMFEQVAVDDGAPAATGATLTVAYGSLVDQATRRDEFTVTVGSLGLPYDEAARQFFLSRRDVVTVNAQDAVVGSDERQFGVQSISFERAGLRITVAGTAPRPILLEAAQSVHVATGDELAALFGAGAVPTAAPSSPAAGTVQLVGDRLSGGAAYTVTLEPTVAANGTVAVFLQSDGVAHVATITPHDSYIATVVSPTMTALIAFVPPDIDDAQLVVTIGDAGATTTLSAVPTDLPGGLRVAALAFDQMQPYEAAIHTTDGRTLSAAAG